MNRANDPEAHFSEVPKRFSTRKAVAYACVQLVGAQSEKRRAKKNKKISNLMTSKLFYAHILNMN